MHGHTWSCTVHNLWEIEFWIYCLLLVGNIRNIQLMVKNLISIYSNLKWEPSHGLHIDNVLTQSSGRPTFFSGSMISRSGSRVGVSGSFLEKTDQNKKFSKILWIEILNRSGGFLSSGSKSPED